MWASSIYAWHFDRNLAKLEISKSKKIQPIRSAVVRSFPFRPFRLNEAWKDCFINSRRTALVLIAWQNGSWRIHLTLLKIVNRSLKSGEFTRSWKRNLVIPKPKVPKSTFCQSIRRFWFPKAPLLWVCTQLVTDEMETGHWTRPIQTKISTTSLWCTRFSSQMV